MVKRARSLLLLALALVTLLPAIGLLFRELTFTGPEWRDLLADDAIRTGLLNSLISSLVTGLVSVAVAFPAAFVFAKGQFRGKDILFFLYIAVMILPFQVTMLPHYLVSKYLGVYDSLWALILPGIFAPFSVFALTQSLRDFPDETIQAARLETSSYWRILTTIVWPQNRSNAACIFLLAFSEMWNSVAEPLVLLESSKHFPLSVLLEFSSQAQEVQLLATVLFFSIPLALYILLGRHVFASKC